MDKKFDKSKLVEFLAEKGGLRPCKARATCSLTATIALQCPQYPTHSSAQIALKNFPQSEKLNRSIVLPLPTKACFCGSPFFYAFAPTVWFKSPPIYFETTEDTAKRCLLLFGGEGGI